jgi:uncharacterized damage-inducible protein DinB
MVDALTRLFAHMRWADLRILESLRQPAAATTRALEIFAHILAAEHVWLARVRGTPPRVPVWPPLALEECATLAAETHGAFDALVRSLDDAAAERLVRYRNSAGAEFQSRLSDILLHVALHGTYHRGQVSLLVRTAGAVPATTDFIELARGAPAARN